MTAPLHQLTDTWNNAGIVFRGISLDVTNTASASGSRLLDLLVNGVSKFAVDKSGILVNGPYVPEFNTGTDMSNAIIPKEAKSAVIIGFSNINDGGLTIFHRVNSQPTHACKRRSSDRWKLDETEDNTDGGWWEFTVVGGEINLAQTGGKGDWNGSTGTDNLQPLYDALSMPAWQPSTEQWSYKIRLGAGRHRFSDTIYNYIHNFIEGVSGNYNGAIGPTILEFPNNKDCFVYHGGNTGPNGAIVGGGGASRDGVPTTNHGSSTGSTLKNVAIVQDTGGWVQDLTRRAIYARTTIHLENVALSHCSGKAIYIKAFAGYGGDLEGNANQCSIKNVYVHSAYDDGLHLEGADVNGCVINGFQTHTEVFGCGIKTQTYISNTFNGLQITGYGNKGVHRAGRHYTLVSADAATAAATTPGSNTSIWWDMGAGGASSQFPEWNPADADQHRLRLPIYDSGGGSHYYDPYVEIGGAAIGVCHAPSKVFGGTLNFTDFSNHEGQQGGGVRQTFTFVPGTPEHTKNSNFTNVWMGAPSESYGFGPNGGLTLLGSRRYSDGDFSYEFGYFGGRNNLAYRGLNQKSFFELTPRSTLTTAGRVLPAENYFLLQDFILEDPNNSNNGRIRGIRPAAPSAALNNWGEYAAGERYDNLNGAGRWICTVGGVIHNVVWSNGVYCDGNTLLKTSGPRFYKCRDGGNSTVEPTHTSGTQVVGGITFTYLGNTAPTFYFNAEIAPEALTANRTYYVATTGSDTSGDGSSGQPWATIAKALDYVSRNLYLAGYTVKIQLADGTYNGATVNGDGNPHIVGGYVWLSGNDTNPENVLIQSTTIEAFGCGDGAYFFLSGMKVESTVTAVLACFGGTLIFGKPAMGGFGGRLIIGRPQGAAWSNLINCSQAGVVYDQTTGGVEVDTGGVTLGRIASVSSSGYISLWKVRINGNHTILTAGFSAVENGVIWVGDATITGGTVTGKRFNLDTGGKIYGKALDTLPGDVAGTYETETLASATFDAGVITASKPITIKQTWNDVTVPFVGLDFNLTDTLSHAASAPALFRINGSTKWALRKDGAIVTKPPASASPGVNGDVLVEATSDTLLTTKFKGSDGTIRSAGMQMGGPLTGVVTVSTSAPSGGNDGDIWLQYT
jgi:hypothetical protein